MKFPRKSLSLIAVCLCALVALHGCTNAATTADQAKINADNAAIAKAQTQPSAATTVPLLQAQLAADNAQLAADNAALKATVAQQAAQIASAGASFLPPPWNGIVIGVLTLATAGLGAYSTSQGTKLQKAVAVIQAAAPEAAKLIGQATDNQTLASDITAVSQVPGLSALLQHPTAQAALTVARNVATAIASNQGSPAPAVSVAKV